MIKFKEIHSNIQIFADDTSLYKLVDIPDSCAKYIICTLKESMSKNCSG